MLLQQAKHYNQNFSVCISHDCPGFQALGALSSLKSRDNATMCILACISSYITLNLPGKDVSILNIVQTEEEKMARMKKGRTKTVKDLTDLTVLPREEVSEKIFQNEVVITQMPTEAVIEEIEGKINTYKKH